jgi:RNA polymerase sigma factor (sigma-70 family)
MQDREIVAAIVAGEPGGLAAAYGRYAPVLHAYCRSMLDEQDAADAVQDTFIIAADKLAGLRDPDRLRPWLYAVARNECRRRLRLRASAASLDEAGVAEPSAVTDETDPGTGVQRAELRVLVGEALAGMNASDREIIELNLRHDLDGADLADALGVPRNQAHALASRARSHFETSLGALLVARSGRQACPELAGILSGWDAQMTPLLRKRINRHIERCERCGERKRRELSPVMLLGLLPVAALPVALREQVFRLVSGTSPAAAAHRAQVVERAGHFGHSGFPPPLDPPRLRTRRASHLTAAAGAAAALMAGVAVLTFFLMHQHGSSPAGPQAAGPTPHVFPSPVVPGGTPTASSHVSASPGPSGITPGVPGPPGPGPSRSPGQPSPGRPSASPSGSGQPPPSPTTAPPSGSPSPTPAPPPPAGTLTESPATVYISPSLSLSGLTWWTGTFTLTAHGGRVGHYAVSVPSRYAGKLTVSPASGSLANGSSVTVTVRAPVTGLFSRAKLTVSPGNITVTVCYSALGG